jgi:CDP-glycerol glycerophosphotransferase
MMSCPSYFHETSMATDKNPTTDLADDIRRLEERIAMFDGMLKSMLEQMMSLSHTVLERVKRDDVRMAMLEANRVVQALARGAQFFPKTRTVVFVGRSSFTDNVKYAYLAFCAAAKEKNVRCVFLPFEAEQHEMLEKAGLPSLSPQVASWTRDDARTLLGASVAVLADNFHAHSTRSPVHYGLLQGARTVQLWHGIPLKQIGLQHIFAPGGQNSFLYEILGSSGFFDVLAGPSAASEAEWRDWFAFSDFAPIGNPRNDIFYREATAHDLLNVDEATLRAAREARKAGRAVILYGPTFRDHIGPDWLEKSGVIAVLADARMKGHEVLVNLHPFEQDAVGELRKRYPALTFVEGGTDIYPIAKHASVFITDYSSLAFDMLHAGVPLIFYRPDHADYMARARELIPGREGYTPGEIVSDAAALTRAIAAAVEASRNPEKDKFRDERQDLFRKLFDHKDGEAGARLAEIILQQIEAVLQEQVAGGRKPHTGTPG